VPDLSALKSAALAAAWAALVALLAWVQHALENAGAVPALLKPDAPLDTPRRDPA
jgi:hypothetical protein